MGFKLYYCNSNIKVEFLVKIIKVFSNTYDHTLYTKIFFVEITVIVNDNYLFTNTLMFITPTFLLSINLFCNRQQFTDNLSFKYHHKG